MSTYIMLRAILIVICLDNVLFGLGLIAWLIFGRKNDQ